MLSEELNFNKINIEPALKEMNFGSWENQSWDDIDRNQLEKWCNDFVNERPPNGENLQDVYKRVTNFITSLKSKKITIKYC